MSEREDISREITDTVEAKTVQAIEKARGARRRGAYFWLVMVAYMVMAPAIAILVSRNLAIQGTRKSEQKLCTVVVTTDDAWYAHPPPGVAGKAQAENFHKLRRALGCPPHKGV